MLNFTRIRWKNLLSTGNYFIDIPLDKSQNTLVVGENGAGKSTILDALCFALYNKPFRNINKPSLTNSINQKDTLVEVYFHTENHKFKVIRGIKPAVFEIYKDSELVNQDAEAKDYQDYLESFILKLNYKSFTQIVILGSASFTPFMQLSASDRRSIIEDLLDIQIFSMMNSLVKNRQADLDDRKLENKMKIMGTNEKIVIQKRYISEAQQGVEKLVLEYKTEIEAHKKEVDRLAVEISQSEKVIQTLREQITDKPKVQASLKKLVQLETQIEHNLSKHKKTKSFFETEETCPTCAQNIEELFKSTQLTQISGKIGEYESGLIQLEEKITSHQSRLQEIDLVERDITKHSTKIAENLTSQTHVHKFIKSLEEKITSVQTKHDSIEREQERLHEHNKDLVLLEEEKKEMSILSEYYDVANALLKDSGIKTKIVRQYLPIINTLVNKYLANMDFFVNFNLDESFKETIKSRYRDDFSYASFSEGEKQRIDMALMLTWRSIAKLKNSANTNLLILDEIFDSSMDHSGADELMKILHQLDGTNVFVISHRGDILQDKFSHVIKFTKKQNFSHIVS